MRNLKKSSRRSAIVALLSLPLSFMLAVQARAQGHRAWLTIDLEQWRGIEVTLGKETVVLTAQDIFEALKED